MITLPIILTHKDISIFPDHLDCNLYYCIRTTPHVRTNEIGEPVFRAEFWSAADPKDQTAVSGFTGGGVNFDVNLSITETEKKEIKEKIKSSEIQKKRYEEIIAKEKKRGNLISTITRPSNLVNESRQSNAMRDFIKDEARVAQSQIPQVGEVTFGSIIYTAGTVDILEQKGEGQLVEWHSGGGKPAMFGDNNSATALRLTPKGAAVFYSGIMGRTKSIGIRFDLKLRMCMPALNIRIYAGSIQTGQTHSLINHVDKHCTEKIKSKEITQLLTDMGFINIDVERLSTDMDDNLVNSIRTSMMSILEKKVDEIIKAKIQPLTPEERNSKLETIINEEFKSFTELNFTESSVFDFNIAPQATIYEFFENITEEQLNKMVTTIDLSKQVFAFNEITLCASAPWDEKPFVNNVKLECEYPSIPKDNSERKRAFVFDKTNAAQVWHFRKPKNDDGKVIYTPHVYLRGRSDSVQLPTQTTEGGYILVNIGKIGIIDVGFRAHPNTASLPGDLKVSGFQVDLWYKDGNGKMLMGPEQIVTTNLEEELKFERNLGIVLDQPLHYKITYIFKNIDPITLPEKTFYMANDGVSTIFADFPFNMRKNIQVELPLVPNENVKEISGEIHYGNYIFPVTLSQEDEWQPVKVNLCTLDERVDNYTYQFKLKYNNKEYRMASSGVWKGDNDSSSLVVPLKRIEVAGIDLLHLGEKYYRADVEIRTSDEDNKPIIFSLSKKDRELESKVLYMFYPDDKKLTLNWKVTLTEMSGTELPPITGKSEKTFIVLTPPKNN